MRAVTLKSYNSTLGACFTGYICQAIVNNFAPLLFLTFQSSLGIPLSQITLLVTINFGVQLLVDLLSAKLVDRIGYRAAAVGAHLLMGTGFILMGTLPFAVSRPFYDSHRTLHAGVCGRGDGILEQTFNDMGGDTFP